MVEGLKFILALVVGILLVFGYVALIVLLIDLLRKKENSLQNAYGEAKEGVKKRNRLVVLFIVVLVVISILYYIFL